ncbi:MAG: hypothetical protein KDA60_09650 [Planctomycetales bacterium]|nr:hypothetical protein [Planctomycetales bacterium]
MPKANFRACALSLLLTGSLLSTGCTLREYRLAADQEAYCIVDQKSNDPRWAQPGFTIEMDPRSRYYDPFDPDANPMPSDDPFSHQYMHCVDGKHGWDHWHDNGSRSELENPSWRENLEEYAQINEEGELVLSADSALEIAYIHSPSYQQQLETLYLSALDVSAERFAFDTKFFGGTDVVSRYSDRASAIPNKSLSVDNGLSFTRRFATAGDLVVGFANSFVWNFSGTGQDQANSLINFTLTQPLLRNAGRDRALETLTRAERGLLANVRQMERYRQGFYTDVIIGQSGVGNVSRLGGFQGGTGLTGFSGTGRGGLGGVGAATGFGGGFFGGGTAGGGTGGGTGLAGGGAGQVGGFVGLLQSFQEIRNTQYSLDLQLRTLALLEANLEAGTIDLAQIDQFRQNIETLRAQLLQARAGLQTSLDNYKTGTLGLPPDLPIALDDSFIGQFQLIDPEVTELQDDIAAFQGTLGDLPEQPAVEGVRQAIATAEQLLAQTRNLGDRSEANLEDMAASITERKQDMTETEGRILDRDIQQLKADFARRPQQLEQLAKDLDEISAGAAMDAGRYLKQLVGWTRRLNDELQTISLLQARARLESVVVKPIQIDETMALAVARQNRLDYMNNRAALVDSWRLIAFNADQLQSVLNVQLSGNLGSVGTHVVDFSTGALQGRVEFDAPLTRLLERNNYRQSLVDYQRSRRQLIQFDDSINQSMRSQLRNLEQLRTNLEIQRRAVIISIRRADFTRAELNRPLPTPEPGAAANTFGPTAVQNLLSALSDLSNAQNNFMSVWLNYYAGRMQLVRDLGLMQLDEQGRWVDIPLDELLGTVESCEPAALPPSIPLQWWEAADELDRLRDPAAGEGSAPIDMAPEQNNSETDGQLPLPNPHLQETLREEMGGVRQATAEEKPVRFRLLRFWDDEDRKSSVTEAN